MPSTHKPFMTTSPWADRFNNVKRRSQFSIILHPVVAIVEWRHVPRVILQFSNGHYTLLPAHLALYQSFFFPSENQNALGYSLSLKSILRTWGHSTSRSSTRLPGYTTTF